MSERDDDTPSWDGLLSGHAPRDERDAAFPPDLLEDESPILLSRMGDLVAAAVAARVLEVVARRGGAHHTPSDFGALRARLTRALPEHASRHADAEARRVLEWLTDAAPPSPPSPATRQLEVMDRADVDSRAQLVRYAMDASLELELELHVPHDGTWERLRGAPEELIEGAEPSVVLRLRGDRAREVELRDVRWLMPVRPRGDITHREEPQVAEVVTFPGFRLEPVDGD
jgi:hypothetical protein